MPTVPSSTDLDGRLERLWRPVADTGHLLRFRSASVRRPRAAGIGWGVLLLITTAAAVVPALVPDAASDGRAFETLVLLPTFMVGFLLLAIVSAVASGGGRELLPHEQAVAYPVSPTTDHLGALLMAPLNIAWLIQAWFLLGAAAYGRGTEGLLWLQLVVLLWLAVATAVAQVIAWATEAVRRGPHGVGICRAAIAVVGATVVWLHLSDNLGPVLDAVPTVRLVVGGLSGPSWTWLATVAVEVAILVVAVLVGAWPAHVASRRMPRDELDAETGDYPARRTPRTVLGMLVRIDRASVWRSVPMRRGLAVLAVGPGLVAFAGGLGWDTVTVLPALVVSGGVLLFGVNAWSLDGRGGLWRESLPADPAAVFTARTWVLAEWLLLAALVTVVLASLRAGAPTASQAAALVCTVVVVTLQVVAVAMSWSLRRPFAVNLRSARATPAPPIVMVGYSARLATSTTLTAMVFSTLSRAETWWVNPAFALPFLVWSTTRWWRARRRWTNAPTRALVVTTVAA